MKRSSGELFRRTLALFGEPRLAGTRGNEATAIMVFGNRDAERTRGTGDPKDASNHWQLGTGGCGEEDQIGWIKLVKTIADEQKRTETDKG